MNSVRTKWVKFILCLLPFGFLTTWYFSYYWNHDLVWDELVSLTNFILTDFHTTVTTYPDVNNHVLFSLIYNVYCKLIHVTSIYQAMSETSLVRLLSFGFSLIAVTYTYLIGKRFFSFETGVLAAGILVTTIPYLNFAFQLRGYSISTTFLVGLVYHVWAYRDSENKWHLLWISLFTAALIYTIPSNIYFGICLGAALTFIWWRTSRKQFFELRQTTTKKKKKENPKAFNIWFKENSDFKIIVALIIGAMAAYLAYQPILDAILNERHLQQMKGQSHHWYNLKEVLPQVYLHFFSFRILLAIPLIILIPSLFRKLRTKDWRDDHYRFFLLLCLALLPFVLGFIRGDRPPQRTFTPLAPIFSLILAYTGSNILPKFSNGINKPLISQILVFAYFVGTSFFCRYMINTRLHKAINDGEMVYNSFYNFYQSDEYGFRYLDPLVEAAKTTHYPIIMAQEIDRVAEGEYLHKNDLTYFSTVWAKEAPDPNGQGKQLQVLFEMSNGKGNKPGYSRLAFPGTISVEAGKLVPMYYFLVQQKIISGEDPHFYVLTFAPRWFEKIMSQYFPQLKAEKISDGTNYHNSYLVTKR